MWDWIRKIPTPGYGKCGGASRDCSTTPPRDWMDKAFELHDRRLEISRSRKEDIEIDKRLGKDLRAGDPKKLSLWGKIYLFGAKIVFR